MSHDPTASQSITGSYNAQTDGKGAANVNVLNFNLTPDLPTLSDAILRQATANAPSEERTDSFVVPVNMVPYERNAFFTGRENVLANLYQNLLDENRASLPLPQAISGLGGIGKTQIAVEYAFRNQNVYEHILWINADSYETLVSNFVSLTQLLHLIDKQESDSQHIIQTIKYWLHNHLGWLLIFDNVNDLSMIGDFLRFGERGHILMTTNSPITGTVAQCLEIKEMDDKEGALFLLCRAKILDLQAPLTSASTEDRQTAFEIVQKVEGLPLALDQAGAYIEETRCSLADYLLLFRTRQNELLKRRGKSITNHPDSVTTTLSLSFEKVHLANPAATDIMQVFAFLNSDAIPEDILTQGFSTLGGTLKKVAKDPLLLNDAISTLHTYSLVHRNPGHTFTVHRLVQAVVRHSMSPSKQKLWVKRVISAINLAFPETDYANWQRCQQYIPHIQVCVELLDQWGLAFAEVADLLTKVGRYLDESVQYQEAEIFYQHALAIREKTQGPEHPGTATTLHFLAHLYEDQGKFEQAETFHQRELAIREKTFGAEHPDTAKSLHCIARLYREQGKYEQAETCYQRALAIREKVLGPEHPETASTLSGYAVLLRKVQRIQEARVFEKRARATRKKASDLRDS